MVILTVDYFNQVKDYIHPNLHEIVKDHTNRNLISFPPFHGCALRNRNGTRKLIDYSRGNRCITPSWRIFWKKDVKMKYFHNIKRYPATRYLTNSKYRNLFKNKGDYVYNYKLKVYKHMNESPLNDIFVSMKKYKNALSKEA